MRAKSLLILLLIIGVILPAAFKFDASFVPEVSASTLPDSSGRLIVGFRELPSTFPIGDFVAQYGGGQVVGTNYVLKFAVVVPSKASFFAANALQDKRVSYIEPDGLAYAAFTPNDPSFSSQWGPPAIQATWAWNFTLGSRSVIVAVVDTGVQYDHPDLSSNMWKNSDGSFGWNFVSGNNNPRDDNGHGTHVAGIVAATINNGIGVAGISQSRIMAVKVLKYDGTGYWSNVASGIQWATDHGAKIVNLSLGGDCYDNSKPPKYICATLETAVTYAYGSGVLIVAAAGNQYGGAIQYPALYDQVIAVTAIDQNNQIAPFSSIGSKAELTAPGVNIYSTYYYSQYAYMDGTSMATPFVSGVAALIWSVDSTISRDAVRSILDSTADDLGSPGRDNLYGYGRVNAYRAVLATPLPSAVADLDDFSSSPSGNVTMVIGDIAINQHGSKPSGVGYQQGRDTTPLGDIRGMLNNAQPCMFDTDAAIDVKGRPVGDWPLIFSIGGPDINAVTHYYESPSNVSDRAPIKFGYNSTYFYWSFTKNGTKVPGSSILQSDTAVPPGTSDVFVIQILRDADGRLVVLMYGARYTGTWAAAEYFKFIVYPTIATYTDSYYIVRWTDAASGTSANMMPDSGDTYAILAQGSLA
jgi:thermitase